MQGNHHEVERIQLLCSIFFFRLAQKCPLLFVTDFKVLQYVNVHTSWNVWLHCAAEQ